MHHLVSALLISFTASAALGQTVENFVLFDSAGVAHELYQSKERKAVVIMAHSLGCPAPNQTMVTFNEIVSEYKKRGVEFFFLNPNAEDSAEKIDRQMQQCNSQIPVLLDPAQFVTRILQVQHAAEVVVIQAPAMKIVFRGPIGEEPPSQGVPRLDGSKNYLRETLEAILNDHPEGIPSAPPASGRLLRLAQEPPASYAKTIVPILIAKCYRCHNGSDPSVWKMDSYASVKRWSPMMRETILTRRMPPWWAEPRGAENFISPQILSAKEESRLLIWLQAGAPHEESPDPLLSLAKEANPTFERELRLPQPLDIPANGEIEYQYAKLMVADRDLYIRGVKVLSGVSSIHHGVLFAAPEADSRDPDLIHSEANSITLGGIKRILPEPLVYFLPKGYALYIQMHLRTLGHPLRFDPSFGLQLAKPHAQIRVLHELRVRTKDIHLPAGDSDYRRSLESRSFDRPVEIAALSPHMHLRGKSMKINAVYPDGSIKLLLSVPKFDPHFETSYWFKKPVKLPPGSHLVVSAAYDNSANNPYNPDPHRDVPWGRQINDEMFLAIVNYVDSRKPF